MYFRLQRDRLKYYRAPFNHKNKVRHCCFSVKEKSGYEISVQKGIMKRGS